MVGTPYFVVMWLSGSRLRELPYQTIGYWPPSTGVSNAGKRTRTFLIWKTEVRVVLVFFIRTPIRLLALFIRTR